MPFTIDRDAIESIAGKCQTSGNNIQTEAANMKTQMEALRNALQGIPNLAMADRFNEWNALFTKMSQSLEESNAYLRQVVQTVDNFVRSLG